MVHVEIDSDIDVQDAFAGLGGANKKQTEKKIVRYFSFLAYSNIRI